MPELTLLAIIGMVAFIIPLHICISPDLSGRFSRLHRVRGSNGIKILRLRASPNYLEGICNVLAIDLSLVSKISKAVRLTGRG